MSLLLRRFAEHTAACPTAPAYLRRTGPATTRTGGVLPRAALLAAAVSLADQLRRGGIDAGDVVALHAPVPSALFAAVDLAVLACGAVPASLPERPTTTDAGVLLDQLHPTWLIDTAPSPSPLWTAAAAATGVHYRHQPRFPAPSVPLHTALNRTLDPTLHNAGEPPGACVVCTSGSSGAPQPVLLAEQALADGVDAWRRCWPPAARAARRTLAYLPVSHIAQRIMSHYLMCLYGVTVAASTPARWVDALVAHRPQLLLGVPHTLAALAAAATRPQVRSAAVAASLVLNGAAALPTRTTAALTKLGITVANAYGMTETTVPVAHLPTCTGTGHLGRLVDGVQVRLGSDGELQLRTPYAGRYVTTWPLTRPVTDPHGWLATGDHATSDETDVAHATSGRPAGLRLTGRTATTFKTTRGVLVHPEPVEAHLTARPDVAAACVLGVPVSPFAQPASTAPGRVVTDGAAVVGVALVNVPASASWTPQQRKRAEQELLADLRTARRAGTLPASDLSAVRVCADDWAAIGMLTRTGKPRRDAIAAHYTSALISEQSVPPPSTVTLPSTNDSTRTC